MAKAVKKKKAIKKKITAQTIGLSADYFIVINEIPVVRPGSAHVFGSQQIWWVNSSTHTVRVKFPHGGVIGQPFSRVVEPGEMRKAPERVNGSQKGRFTYKVVDLVTGRLIPGNSNPDIIVEG